MSESDVGRLMGHMCPRWDHVRSVGRLAELLAASHARVGPEIVEAAWWHDIGYLESVREVGQHSIDGARFLKKHGFGAEVCSLVAWHTGAKSEAEARGLLCDLAEFPRPNSESLDILTMIDLSVGPLGQLVSTEARVREILDRYGPADLVHQAVQHSKGDLVVASERAKVLLGLADEWPICDSEGISDSL